MIAIIDYGVGNLFSLRSSLRYIGQDAEITGDAEEIRRSDRVILPGVGAFEDAARKLRDSGLADIVRGGSGAGQAASGYLPGHAAAL